MYVKRNSENIFELQQANGVHFVTLLMDLPDF